MYNQNIMAQARKFIIDTIIMWYKLESNSK